MSYDQEVTKDMEQDVTKDVEWVYTIETTEYSEWQCYLYGAAPGDYEGMVYRPVKGAVPNWFVRWMMKVCLGCTWVKEKQNATK